MMKGAMHRSGKNFGLIGGMFAGTECLLGKTTKKLGFLTAFKMDTEDGMIGHHPQLPALSLAELWAFVLE